eukprot:CAMPEP_0181343954 /NCGR_PEP_ID=MMETSP1101-20121128/31896_1 /TAXON_ID=46948 /ORGANISM="Rhodomonas abbreviata, Strain Caron Lab Isolate" /LENGTH=78 /DNA_ID=CAMNT_0023455687 /DNA_START=33 /DNA_END=265 /DNA_ORIENTATION=+
MPAACCCSRTSDSMTLICFFALLEGEGRAFEWAGLPPLGGPDMANTGEGVRGKSSWMRSKTLLRMLDIASQSPLPGAP